MRKRKGVAVSPAARLEALVYEAPKVARTAKRNRASLTGLNFYANKMAKLRTDATIAFKELGEPSVGDITAVAELLETVFSSTSDLRERTGAANDLVHEIRTQKWRTTAGGTSGADLFPQSLLTKTQRGYIITVGRQMNGCFESGFYDASAVMMRRLLETAIIEAFESKSLEAKIKNSQGGFFQLTDLIKAALSETAWNLSRGTQLALPRLRDIGHMSAHSRRFTAQRSDVAKVEADCRVAIEEFLHIAGLL